MNLIKFTILSFFLIFLYSCVGPSMNALTAYKDCSYKFDNVVKVDQCAKGMMQTFSRQNPTGVIYGSNSSELQFYQGLVYKVQSNQISNSEALNRYANYKQQKEQAAKEEARKLGEAADGMNCLLFGVAC